MKSSTIPTLLALLILIICLVSVVVIVKGPKIFKSGASASTAAHDIRITNVRDTSITVSWTTDKPSIGFVKYSSNNQSTNTAATNLSKIHFVTIQNLTPGFIYSIEVNSDGEFSDPKQVQTLTSYAPSTKIISGQILDEKNLPVKDVLVYVATEGVIKYSALTSTSGNWIMALTQLPDSTILQVLATGGETESSAFIDLQSANPTPIMVLGKNYDFRNQEKKESNDVPQLKIEVP